MWHVSSRSGVATLRTAMHLLLMLIAEAEHPPQRGSAIAKVTKLTRVNTSLTLSCKLVQVFAMIWLCCFITKSSARFACTLALNSAFLVSPIESPRCGGPSPLQTTSKHKTFYVLLPVVCFLLSVILNRKIRSYRIKYDFNNG